MTSIRNNTYTNPYTSVTSNPYGGGEKTAAPKIRNFSKLGASYLSMSEEQLLDGDYTITFNVAITAASVNTYILDNGVSAGRGYIYYDGTKLVTNLVSAVITIDGGENVITSDGKLHAVRVQGKSTGQTVQRWGANWAGGANLQGFLSDIVLDNKGVVSSFHVSNALGSDTEVSVTNNNTLTYVNTSSRELYTLSGDKTEWVGEEGGSILISPLPAPASFSPIFQRLSRGSLFGGYNYVITGDSTRDNLYNYMQKYYKDQFTKIGFSTVDNAKSGQSTAEWAADTYYPEDGITAAIEQIPNTGKKTIVEYSLGINDNGTHAVQKQIFREGIQAYLTAKPDILMVLVTPVAGDNVEDSAFLRRTFKELGVEFSLPVVDVQEVLFEVLGNPDYYKDGIHPTRSGSARVVNWITGKILHPSLYETMTIEELAPPMPTEDNIAANILQGSWDINGVFVPDVGKRCMSPISVEPKQSIQINHGGDILTMSVFNQQGSFIEEVSYFKGLTSASINLLSDDTYEVRINLSEDGTSFDASPVVNTVQYSPVLTQEEININMPLKQPII